MQVQMTVKKCHGLLLVSLMASSINVNTPKTSSVDKDKVGMTKTLHHPPCNFLVSSLFSASSFSRRRSNA